MGALRPFLRSCLAVLACFVTLCSAQAISNLPLQQNFLRRAHQRSIILGHFLYIDGGELNQINTDTGNPEVSTQNTNPSIDLATSWNNQSVAINSIAKVNPVVKDGIVWSDPNGKSFYSWGGYETTLNGFNYTVDTTLWRFDADNQGGGTWKNDSMAPSSLSLVQDALFATGNGVGYAVGGHVNLEPYLRDDITGLVAYDMASGGWTNSSTSDMGANGTAIAGELIFTSAFGDQGILLALDGSVGQLDSQWTLNDLSQIQIYDIASQQWHSQATSGNAPPAREGFCAVGLVGEHSYEIFLHGGFGAELTAYDDVYVLSLPSFSWYQANYTPGVVGRTLHTCNVAANSQMIVVDGLGNIRWWVTGVSPDENYRDPWPWGLGVFDLNGMQWASEYNAQAANYSTPAMVTHGLRANGTAPAQWSSSEIQQIMAKTTLNTTLPAASTSAQSAKKSSSTLSKGAIAGIAIGVIAGFLLICSIVGYLCVRRRRSGRQKIAQPMPGTGIVEKPERSGYAPVRTAEWSPVSGDERTVSNLPSEMYNPPAPQEMNGQPAPQEMHGTERYMARHELHG